MPEVTTTARWAAAQRALESRRADRLFTDPLASPLAGQEGTTALEISEKLNPRHADTAAYIAIRVRFLDDFLMRLASDGIRQIVLLAAGMDARAYRLAWPAGTSVYELDHAELLETKEAILKHERAEPSCRRIALGVDLREDWTTRLEESGFSRTEISVWILEGLLYYLRQESIHRIFQQISGLAARGSGLGADIVSQSTLTSPWMQDALSRMEKSGIGWKFGTDDPETFLDRLGWKAEVRQLGEEGANYGRWKSSVVPRTRVEVPRTFLVEAQKK